MEVTILSLLCVLMILGTVCFALRNPIKWFVFFLTTDIPGPGLWELVTVYLWRSLGDGVLECLLELSERYQHKPWGVWWLNGQYVLIVSDWKSMTEVMKNKYIAAKSDFMYENVAKLADGLFNLNGSTYKRHRKLISTAFRAESLRDQVQRVNDGVANLVQQLDETNGETADVREWIDENSLITAMQIFFTDSYTYPGSTKKLAKMVRNFMKMAHEKTINIVLYWLKWSNWKLEREMSAYMNELRENFVAAKSIASVLVEGDGRPSNQFQATAEKGGGEAGEDRFTEEEFFQETKTVVMAAFETTSKVETSCIYFLALNQDIQERVYEEMKSIFGESDRQPDFDDLGKMVYLEQVLKETLRLIPPGLVLARQPFQDVTLNGVVAPKGCLVFLNVVSMHRDPEVYKDPMKFDPERFSQENSASRPQYAYVPFSGGVRSCPGRMQAGMTIKVYLSAIVRNFVILPGDGLKSFEDLKIGFKVVARLPEMPLRFIRRRKCL